MKHFNSVFINEQELIQAILDIHNNGEPLELDPMYNKGSFYKNIVQRPKYTYDLHPQNGAELGDATKLNFGDNQIKSMILDPPFMFRKMIKSQSVIANRYTMFENFEELQQLYIDIIKEASRILIKNGLLIFKVQDFTNSKTTMTHCYAWKWIIEQGFYVKDLVILNKIHKITNGNLKQRHFRKTHSYFFVCIKKKEGK